MIHREKLGRTMRNRNVAAGGAVAERYSLLENAKETRCEREKERGSARVVAKIPRDRYRSLPADR